VTNVGTRRDRFGRGPGRADRHIFQTQLHGVWHRHLYLRNRMLAFARKQRLSFCRDHTEHRPADRAPASALDRRLPSVCGSIAGNRHGAAGRNGVASAGDESGGEGRAWRICLPDL